jgi:hypothetical protein
LAHDYHGAEYPWFRAQWMVLKQLIDANKKWTIGIGSLFELQREKSDDSSCVSEVPALVAPSCDF